MIIYRADTYTADGGLQERMFSSKEGVENFLHEEYHNMLDQFGSDCRIKKVIKTDEGLYYGTMTVFYDDVLVETIDVYTEE